MLRQFLQRQAEIANKGQCFMDALHGTKLLHEPFKTEAGAYKFRTSSSLSHKRKVINTGQVMNWDINTACLYLSSKHTRCISGSLSARLV